MLEHLVAQYREWNDDSPVAGGLLQQAAGGVRLLCENRAYRSLFSGRAAGSEPYLAAGAEPVAQALAERSLRQWTVFDPVLGRYLLCSGKSIAPGVCEFWIQFDYQAEETTLNDLPVGIVQYSVDPKTNTMSMTYVNRQALRINGCPDAVPVGQTDAEYRQTSIYPEDRAAAAEVTARFLHGTEPVPYEARIVRPDQSIRWLNGVISWLTPGRVCQTVYLDVTTKKEAELAAEKARNLLDNILSTTQTAIFWKDANRRFLGANRAFLDYYGFSSVDALLGRTDEDMGWHPDPDPYKNDELRVLRGERTARVPGTCLLRGEMRDIVASKAPLYADGKILGLVGSFEDVTHEVRQREEISRLNGQLQAALEKAEQASRAKSDFLARMSHDMRTPLTTVIGLCDLSLDGCRDAELTHSFGSIRDSAEYLLSILTDILDMQKLASGTVTLCPEVCTGERAARAVEEIIRPQAEAKSLRFITDLQCSRPDCYLKADTRRMQQILINLLNNAVKYTPPGGTVRWENRIDSETDGILTVTQVISDNGPGISRAFQEKMYDPFMQEKHSGEAAGNGLGLAIVRGLVDRMGGTIRCDSAPGQGTRFTVTIPHAKASPEEIRAYLADQHPDASAPLFPGHVLVCEDNAVNASIIERLVKSRGLSCDRAENGFLGVQKARTGRYDAILMDIRMPVMGGYEAAAEIRKFDARTPIIALSANNFPDDIQKSLDSGMNAHVAKPIDTKVFFATLSRLMGR
jgi:PAS domain S-box-containing protein